MKTHEQILDIGTFLQGCCPGLSPEAAARIAQAALDAAEAAAKDNRPTPPSVGPGEGPDPGVYWAKRLEEQEKTQ